jgi:soluble lytic murein transglycosylase
MGTLMNSKKKSTIVISILIILITAAVILLAVSLVRRWYSDDSRTHTIEYEQFVQRYAAEYEVDEFLIYAIIKTESGFDPDAVSELGARGLMQIMPDTFEWIKWRWFNDEDLSFDDMYNPQVNIRFGVRLISYHLQYYNNVDNSLAAYHAGDGAVDAWLKDSRYSHDGKTLHTIPFDDTQHYVNKVNKAYEIYLNLYGGQ